MKAAFLSKGVLRTAPSATVAMNERVAALRSAGRTVAHMGFGQSPFPVPRSAVASLRRNAAAKDYLAVAGLPKLRAAAADSLWPGSSEDSVVVAPGSKELLHLTQAVCDAELLVPAGSWVSYEPQAKLLGRDVAVLPTTFEDRFQLQPEVLDAHCRREEGRARLLVLNSPSNPTGQILPTALLRKLATVCRRHGVIVVSDEIYGWTRFGAPSTPSMAAVLPEQTVVTTGVSKWAGAGGWRLGVAHFPEPLNWLRDAVLVAASETYTSASTPIQLAGVELYSRGSATQYRRAVRRVLRAVGEAAAARLPPDVARVWKPEGGFYIMPVLHDLAGVATSEELAERLLDEAGVATLAGSHFGRDASELSLRLSFVDFDGERALRSVADGAEVGGEWVEEFAPSVLDGIDRIVEFARRNQK